LRSVGAPQKPEAGAEPGARGRFVTTHWSQVLAAGEDSERATSFEALSRLCQTYWYPLYSYVRRRGYDADTAADLTQSFFAELLSKNYVGQADPARGRFRSFLLKALEHFLAKEWQKGHRLKRGGGVPLVSFDAAEANDRWQSENTDRLAADALFDRRWAVTVLEEALRRLRQAYDRDGRGAWFAALEGFLSGEQSAEPLAQIGVRLGVTEGAVKVAVHRLRQRYGQTLREIIAETVARPADVEDELRHLISMIADAR
jgi:RNA polymerase sigma-70 factor (ECF subfamily)